MHSGHIYRVACRQLGLPETDWTKEKSREAANEWWVAKAAMIEAEAATQTNATTTIKQALALFLDLEKNRIKPQSFHDLKSFLEVARKDSGAIPGDSAAAAVNETNVRQHYTWLANRRWTNKTKNKALGYFRRFVTWLWSEDILVNLPKNLKVRSHRFQLEYKVIPAYDNVKAELDELEGDCKLWALLGLNCSMTAVDLGGLTWDMIDLNERTLTRRRVKTGNLQAVPTVTYRLFPETVTELVKLPWTASGLVFTTANGQPMYTAVYDGQKMKKKDMFSTQWHRQQRPATIPQKAYRSIGSTVLQGHELWRGFVQLYLGHAPATVAERHYARESDRPFFRALDYLHEQVFTA